MPDDKTQREALEQEARQKISMARVRILTMATKDISRAFFSGLVMKLEPKIEWRVPTAAVDGKRIYYNPKWVVSLTLMQLEGVLVHEVMHCKLKHMLRRSNRDRRLWNIACDLAINSILQEAGFVLPDEGVFAGGRDYEDMPASLAAEDYHRRLVAREQQQQQDTGGDDSESDNDAQQQDEADTDADGDANTDTDEPDSGEADNADDGEADDAEADSGDADRATESPGDAGNTYSDPGGCGGVIDAPPESEMEDDLSEEWDVATIQAANASEPMGNLPSGLAQTVKDVKEPAMPWQEHLREFLRRTAVNDYTWSVPNKRHIGRGMYLPSLHSEEIGEVVIGLDTSGSISSETVARFMAEMRSALEAYECTATVFTHTTEVDPESVRHWTPCDGPLEYDSIRSGGTSHLQVFEWIQENVIDPSCVILFTDMESRFPKVEPDYPVLWAITNGASEEGDPYHTWPKWGTRVPVAS